MAVSSRLAGEYYFFDCAVMAASIRLSCLTVSLLACGMHYYTAYVLLLKIHRPFDVTVFADVRTNRDRAFYRYSTIASVQGMYVYVRLFILFYAGS